MQCDALLVVPSFLFELFVYISSFSFSILRAHAFWSAPSHSLSSLSMYVASMVVQLRLVVSSRSSLFLVRLFSRSAMLASPVLLGGVVDPFSIACSTCCLPGGRLC